MTSSLDLIRGRQVVQSLTNQSGGAIIAGDVVIASTANDESFTTTTSAAYNSTRVGVALESIAAAAAGRILLEGYAPLVNVSASATRGHYLLTHTVAKQATSQSGYAAGAFGQIIKAGTTPSAVIFPVAQVGSSGVARSGSTTDNHLAVWNGSNADSIKDGGVASSGAMVRITQVVVGVGGAANFDLTSIAGTYETLVLHWMGRSDAAGAKQKYVALTINNDSGNNYDIAAAVADDNSVQQDSGTAQTFAWIGYIPAATAPAGSCGAGVLELPNYARTVFHKIGHYRAMHYSEAVSPSDLERSYAAGIRWRNTAAITRLTLTPETGNWLEGSVATLYGVT